MIQGSTGGSGLRTLDPEKPTRIQLSVVYLDPGTGELLAYDDISLGGLGLASAEIDRTVVTPVAPSRDVVSPGPTDPAAEDGVSTEGPLAP